MCICICILVGMYIFREFASLVPSGPRGADRDHERHWREMSRNEGSADRPNLDGRSAPIEKGWQARQIVCVCRINGFVSPLSTHSTSHQAQYPPVVWDRHQPYLRMYVMSRSFSGQGGLVECTEQVQGEEYQGGGVYVSTWTETAAARQRCQPGQ